MNALRLRVKDSKRIADVMQRLSLTGEGLYTLPKDSAGQHIKLFFKKPHQSALVLPEKINGVMNWPEASLQPVSRAFSVLNFDQYRGELDIDFVLHDNLGPAKQFALNAKIGDEVGLTEPGHVSLV